MTDSSYQMTALFENRFWLQILGDHGRFTLDLLAPSEAAAICTARQMIGAFDALLTEARRDITAAQAMTLSCQARAWSCAMRDFQLGLIARQLTAPTGINMTPSMFSHMINETEEYLRILSCLAAGRLPPAMNPIHYNILWLDDEASHAAAISSGLDEVEHTYIDAAMDYVHKFHCLFIKAHGMVGLMRTGLTQFAALSQLDVEAYDQTMAFTKFMLDVQAKRTDSRLLGIVPPLMPDHMAREQCYYMHKLAISACLTPPACDPTRPRVGG